MSSINSFETDMRKLRRKRKNKRIIKNTLFIFLIVAVALAVYATRSVWMSYFDGILERAQFGNSTDIDGELAAGNYPLDISKKTDVQIGAMSKAWTLVADSEFYVYNQSGEVIYSQQVNFSNPVAKSSNKRTLIYDMGGYSFMSMSDKKQVYSKQLTDQILLGAVCDNGNVAIVTSNDKYTSYLTVYDKNGSEVFHWADGNMITAVDINDRGTGCIVSSTYAKGGQYHSVISVIDFSSSELIAKSSPLPCMTFGLEHCLDGQFWAITDNSLYRLASDGTVNYVYNYKLDLADFSLSDKVAVLTFESIDNNHSSATVFSYNDDKAVQLEGYGKISRVYAKDSTIYLCEKNKLSVIDRNGTVYFTKPLDSECKQLAVLNNDIYVMGYKTVSKYEVTYE